MILRSLLLLMLLLPQSIKAQESPDFLDFNIKFGDFTLQLNYFLKGTRTPCDGYLMSIADLAVLKVEIDTQEEAFVTRIKSFQEICTNEVEACQRDSQERFDLLNSEFLALEETHVNTLKNLDTQKKLTMYYSVTSFLVASAVTAIISKFIK